MKINTLYVFGDIPSLNSSTVDFIREIIPLLAISELLSGIESASLVVSVDCIRFKNALCIILITWFNESYAPLIANALLFVFFVESATSSIYSG